MVSKNVISLLVTSLLIHFFLTTKNVLKPLKECVFANYPHFFGGGAKFFFA